MDFVLEHNGYHFGAIEVDQKKFTPAGMAEFLLSMMKLQQAHKNDGLQYVGVFTNGYRFIFVTLKGMQFTFEYFSSKAKVHKAVNWNDLFTIGVTFYSVVKQTIDNNNKINK